MKSPYDDIIHTKYPFPTSRKRMSLENRAAQFAPFAALTGHSSAIQETARLTDQKIELSEDELAILNEKLAILSHHLTKHPIVTFTYFVEDLKKDGGSYQTKTCTLKKIDDQRRLLICEDKFEIAVENLIDLQCELFQ